MRIRTAKYIIKEGVLNAYRNKLMSLASVGIVTASLIIFGIFLLIALNLELNISVLKNRPEMQVFCYTILDDSQIRQVEDSIRTNDKVAECRPVTRAQAFEEIKELLGEDVGLVEGLDESIAPASFIVKVKDGVDSSAVVEEFKSISGVENVRYSKGTIEMITRITYWVKFFSGLMIIILLAVSVFIIANTIKLTVFARRKEINIMKFIGATDWFIRWPFVVEGVIIGVVGAVVAFVATTYGYNAVEGRFNSDVLAISTNFVKLLKIREIWTQVIMIYAMIGVVVGSAGSFISLRKYLRV